MIKKNRHRHNNRMVRAQPFGGVKLCAQGRETRKCTCDDDDDAS